MLPVCIVLVLLVGCGSAENNVTIGARDKVLHWGNGDEPQELDPHIVTGVPEHNILAALMEGLVRKDPATLKPTPGIANSWRISNDGRTYTFYLRANARWSNGDPITAADFVWSWQRALLPALGNQYAYMLFPIRNAQAFASGELANFAEVGVRALDGLTLQVSLENPTPYFLQLLDHYALFPVHRATIEKFGQADERGTLWTRAGNFVGSGPFTLTQWDLNKVIIVEKNPQYWDAASVKLNAIHYYPTQNISTEERMFRAGQLHYTNTVPVEKIEKYRREKPRQIRIAPYLGTYFYRFNTRVEHLQDARVRWALAMSIDRASIVGNVTKAGELEATVFTPPDTMGYTASSKLQYNPAAARQLLAEAGYPDGKGFPATEIIYNTSENHRRIAVAIQQMWKKALNIEVTLQNQDWKVFLDNTATMNYQISRASWIGDYVDPNSFLDMWLRDGGNNRTGWSNPAYDRLILETAPRAATRQQRYAALLQAEAILLEQMPIIPIYTYVSAHLVHPDVKGMPPNLLNYASFKHIELAEPATVDAEQNH